MGGKLNWVAAIAALFVGSAVQAQTLVATPDQASRALGQCFVLKSTGSDRLLVARWLAGAMGMGEATRDMVTVDEAAKLATDKAMAGPFTRLFTRDCADEAAPLIKAQNQSGLEAAGGMLGEMAMRELMSDPKVSAATFAYLQFIDPAAFAALAE